MQALTAAQMREADRLSTERAGIPSLQLMETAGENVYKELMASCSFAPEKSIAFLCGKGNNGGDGLVAARKYLASNPSSSSVLILLFAQSDRLSGDAAVMLQRLQEAGGTVQYMQSDSDWEDVKANVLSAPILVDALLGTGLRGPAGGARGSKDRPFCATEFGFVWRASCALDWNATKSDSFQS
ncbi:MAG: hypothetical protein HY046_06505 [Acidobacteria bacterium]|nr:hypothetical protein [Acidobacteriota bacterium]